VRIDLSDSQLQEVIDYLANNPSAWRDGGSAERASSTLLYRQSGWFFCFAPNSPARQGNLGCPCFSSNVYAVGAAVVSTANNLGVRTTSVFAEAPVPPVTRMFEAEPYLQSSTDPQGVFPTARVSTEQFIGQGQVTFPLPFVFVSEDDRAAIYAVDDDGHLWVKADSQPFGITDPASNYLGLGVITPGSGVNTKRRRQAFTLVLGDSPDFTKLKFVKAGRPRDCFFSVALTDDGDLYIAGQILDSSTGQPAFDISGADFDGSANLAFFKKWKSDVSDFAVDIDARTSNVFGLTYIQGGQIKHVAPSLASANRETTFGPVFDWITNESVSFTKFLQPSGLRLIKASNGRTYELFRLQGSGTVDSSYWRAAPITIDANSAYSSNADAGLQDEEWQKAVFDVNGYVWNQAQTLNLLGEPANNPPPVRPTIASMRFRPSQTLTESYLDFLTLTLQPSSGGAVFIKTDNTFWSGDATGKGLLLTTDAGINSGYAQVGGDAKFDKILCEGRYASFFTYAFGSIVPNTTRTPVFLRRINEEFDEEGNRLNPLTPITSS
jgi:hypothetical protein